MESFLQGSRKTHRDFSPGGFFLSHNPAAGYFFYPDLENGDHNKNYYLQRVKESPMPKKFFREPGGIAEFYML
ncbi:MAG: hypothetical protein COV67_03990 [Nitrospinae bacterium CG11_big_fil_rev_8_21_14_0_20_56_8]|nr:MAG: hypothetical protein COV67_03990 [Nitrospinae bacterium CG11_big_fil_rev_8_21_14_0_20_56_8]